MPHSRWGGNRQGCQCCRLVCRRMAEKSGDRTHQGRLTPLTGFEDQAPHQGAILFLCPLSIYSRRICRLKQPHASIIQYNQRNV